MAVYRWCPGPEAAQDLIDPVYLIENIHELPGADDTDHFLS